MKSFDIFVDRRHVRGDLIIANLPIRNDIAVYSWLVLDCEILNNIVGEKAVSPENGSGGIVLGVNADESVTKYEIAGVYPIGLDANADFQVQFPLDAEKASIEITQTAKEISKKIEAVANTISLGVGDKLLISPLKSAGRIGNATVFTVKANETKNSIIDGDSGMCAAMLSAEVDDPAAVYYETGDTILSTDASVQSLSYLLHLRLIQSDINIGVNSVDFDLYRSLGKLSAAIAVGSDAEFLVGYFVNAESNTELDANAKIAPVKYEMAVSGVVPFCSGSAVLRRMRLLSDIDALGSLDDIDDMTLEDMYYEDIEE